MKNLFFKSIVFFLIFIVIQPIFGMIYIPQKNDVVKGIIRLDKPNNSETTTVTYYLPEAGKTKNDITYTLWNGNDTHTFIQATFLSQYQEAIKNLLSSDNIYEFLSQIQFPAPKNFDIKNRIIKSGDEEKKEYYIEHIIGENAKYNGFKFNPITIEFDLKEEQVRELEKNKIEKKEASQTTVENTKESSDNGSEKEMINKKDIEVCQILYVSKNSFIAITKNGNTVAFDEEQVKNLLTNKQIPGFVLSKTLESKTLDEIIAAHTSTPDDKSKKRLTLNSLTGVLKKQKAKYQREVDKSDSTPARIIKWIIWAINNKRKIIVGSILTYFMWSKKDYLKQIIWNCIP